MVQLFPVHSPPLLVLSMLVYTFTIRNVFTEELKLPSAIVYVKIDYVYQMKTNKQVNFNTIMHPYVDSKTSVRSLHT